MQRLGFTRRPGEGSAGDLLQYNEGDEQSLGDAGPMAGLPRTRNGPERSSPGHRLRYVRGVEDSARVDPGSALGLDLHREVLDLLLHKLFHAIGQRDEIVVLPAAVP